jgi:tetratricopeptide (TPR) repeat protein
MSPEQAPNKIGKSVGEKLRAARIAQHYTQSQLAAPDFSVSYISAIERGQIHPSLRALEILAGRLGLSSTQLLPAKALQDERLATALSITERDDDEVELVLLEAHIQIRQGLAAEAIEQLEKLPLKRLKRSQQLQHRYLYGWAYYKLDQFQESDYVLTEALQIAKELQANYLYGRILNLQALAQAAMRNYAQAIMAHQHCLELLESTVPKDPFFMAQIYMHLGQHYNQLENYPQALDMFHKALALADQLSTAREAQDAYLQISQQYTEDKDYELATLYAYKSTQLFYWEENKHLKSELYYFAGQALMQKNPEEARVFLEEALQKELRMHDTLAIASLKTRYAEWLFHNNRLEEAQRYVNEASEAAQSKGDTLITADALMIQGRIEYALHQYEAGDQHLKAGLEIFERLGSHEELARECVSYAELLEQAGKAHEAFTYFRRAFQSQQKLGK